MTSQESMPYIPNTYSRAEDLANSISHAIGVVLGIAGLMLLLSAAGDDFNRMISALIYGVSIILMFLTSTIYHSITNPTTRVFMKTLDHCAIYLLIAGTHTPFMLVSLDGFGGIYYLIAIWTVAVFGIAFKLYFGHRHPKISLASYLAMGWFIVVAGKGMLINVATEGLYLLAAGGLCYTIGAIFYAWKSLVFNHAIWHLFVIAGAAFHFFSIYWYVIPTNVL